MISPFARALAAAAALAFFMGSALAQSAPAPQGSATGTPAKPADKAGDPVVAIVNGVDIHRSDVEAAREDLPAQYQSFPLEIVFGALVERLIDGKLLTSAGRKDGLANDPEVKERLARLEDQVIQNVYLTRAVKAKLTDDVLKKRYQEYLKNNPPEQEIHVRQILVKTEDEAKAAIAELKSGAKFADVAKKYSTGTSAEANDDLGFIKRGDVVPEFADAAFALKPGDYTQTPVKTQFGYHVILVEESRTSTPPTFEEAKDDLEREASRDVIAQVVSDLREKAKIVRFNPDGSPKTEENKPADSGISPD
ncbi:MAG TPA: peptidylprolyl isomerase [Alphaproteobacteria bacterium]|nr:peptidylprolyl isomerase [Alphaproteobacteria bacterium]